MSTRGQCDSLKATVLSVQTWMNCPPDGWRRAEGSDMAALNWALTLQLSQHSPAAHWEPWVRVQVVALQHGLVHSWKNDQNMR